LLVFNLYVRLFVCLGWMKTACGALLNILIKCYSRCARSSCPVYFVRPDTTCH
jgi:hypothetical protein